MAAFLALLHDIGMAPGAGLLASEREWARAVVVQCGGAVMAEAAEALRDHSGTQNEKCGQSSEKDQTQQHQMRRVPKASPQSMSFPGRSFLLTVRPIPCRRSCPTRKFERRRSTGRRQSTFSSHRRNVIRSCRRRQVLVTRY
jgi:hypothetical protein